jgi:hypothetical protein
MSVSLTAACIATWQTGQGLGWLGLKDWLMAAKYPTAIPLDQLRIFT